jgi:hypothetical protein
MVIYVKSNAGQAGILLMVSTMLRLDMLKLYFVLFDIN